MRVDSFLTISRLIKRRSSAKILLEEGGVLIGGDPAKAGRKIRVGEEIILSLGRRNIRVRVTAIPDKKVSKEAARKMYEILEESIVEEEWNIEEREEPINFLEGR